ncbi:Hypothetical predicted protein [Cloeon dipterum]|uniref:Uncharacterized protein n=1 Tax=Cloeon dipterum TaxID=197152 RepID=A0A8S1CLW2_9INSE|nr:Hypothetical predicted protein [Cloeon dipterum]
MVLTKLLTSLAVLAIISASVSGSFHRGGQHVSQIRDRLSARPVPCTCGVFLQSQIDKKGVALRSGEEENAIYTYPMEETLDEYPPQGVRGRRICIRKCLELGLKHVQQGTKMLCSYSNRDFNQEKIHLFIKNGEDKWYPTKIHSGRAYTCTDGKLV